MSTARRFPTISVDDYLAGELSAEVRHEYIAGEVYAMVDGRINHNRIARNTRRALGNQLEGKPCEEFGPDMKVRIERATGTYIYYPDVSVVCQSNPGSELFQDQPVVIVEVLSESTRRYDLGEKKDAYLTIASLTHYILLELDFHGAIVFHRESDSFARHEYTSPSDQIVLESIAAELTLGELYTNVFD